MPTARAATESTPAERLGFVILVTGAAGKTGREVIRRLSDAGADVRAMVRAEEQVGSLLALGAREGLAGDLLGAADVTRAVDGVRAVYHVCPNVHPREVEIGDVAIAAAINAGVDHFVFHSVLNPDVEAMPHHWLKHRVEQRLQASGLRFTILRPCAYMQNVLPQIPAVTKYGRLEVPYDVDSEFSVVDLGDVAATAAAVLLEPGHEGRTYELCGPVPLSHRHMAVALGAALGQPVEAVAADLSGWQARVRSAGLSPYAIDALTRMFHWYDAHDFVGSPSDLEGLLGRPAGSFEDFVRREIGG
jgi:uncharacterized protein YbjT (DUF2867 family)